MTGVAAETNASRRALARWFACGIVFVAPLAQAQAIPPDPVSQQAPAQRIDSYYDSRATPEPRAPEGDPLQPEEAPAAAPAAGAEAVRFELTKVVFGPSELLSAAELDALAAPYVGRVVGMDDLAALVHAVNDAYRARGINTAQAVLAAQAIEGGVVRVDLVEGRLGELRVAGNEHVGESFILRRIHQQLGELVDGAGLRDDLVYINRTTDLQLRALLQPGGELGQTDILLQAEEPARHSFGVFVDNAGIESTGRERIGAQGHVWGLLGISDLLAGSVAYARGGLEGRVAYSGIVNRRNGRLGVSASRNQINIIDGAYRDLDITGESTSYALDLRQPFMATQKWLLAGAASLSRVESSTEISGEEISSTESNMATLAFSAGYRAAGTEWSFTQAVSRVDIDEPLRNTDKFTLAPGSFNWLQRLGGSGLLTRLNLGWQYSSSDFVPSGNLFQVGGVGTVRGYERGILAGPRGYYANAELHRPYRQNHDVYLFVDYGSVQSDYPRTQDITGAGVGVSGRWLGWLSYSLDVGHAFDQVLGDQDSVSADFRLAATW